MIRDSLRDRLPKVKLVSAAGEPKLIGFSPLRGERGAYVFRVATGTSEPVAAAWIKTSYQWLDGILLTEDDLELIDMNHAGPFRANRQEFVAASVINPVRELNLSVTFPVGFYPDEKNVEVYYQKLPSGAPIEDGALRARLQFTGQTILFNLPYPLMGYRYAIAWKPVAARPLSKRAKAFQGRCLANGVGDSLVRRSLGELEGEWSGLCSVALYVPEPECSTPGRFLRRAGYTTGSMARSREGPETPPMQIDLRTRRGLYLHSWWGSTGIAVGDPGEFEERALSEGMLAGEFVTAIMPFSGDGDGDGFAPPWGIVRVGIMAPVPEVTQDVELFRSACCTVKLTEVAFGGTQMYVIIRNRITNANVQVESLTGFVTGTPVERESLGIPMSESPPLGSIGKALLWFA